jgi:thiaminase/transcriptional activator TenA
MEKAEMAPNNLAYCNFLLNIAESGTATEIAVSILPCAWIYCDVGARLLEKHSPGSDHPYEKWMALYASPEFLEVANWLRGFVDRGVEKLTENERARLEQVFLTAVRYEWLFWEMAWTLQGWPDEKQS